MNKKDSREVIRQQVRIWEEQGRELQSRRRKLEAGSSVHVQLFQIELEYNSMKHAVLLCAVSLKLITREECGRCMEDGVDSVLKPPAMACEDQKGGLPWCTTSAPSTPT